MKPNLVRETLSQQICRFLKAKIIDGELVAGSPIHSEQLAREFGVSSAPVKEALLVLSGEGLLLNIPRRGSVVRNFTNKDLLELYEVRKLIELEALDLLFKKNLVSDELIQEMDLVNKEIGGLRLNGEFHSRHSAFDLDKKFHDRFVLACEHGILFELYSRLNLQAQIVRYSSWNIGPRGDKTYLEHDAIVRALENRNPIEARAAISNHLDSILNDFSNAIEKEAP